MARKYTTGFEEGNSSTSNYYDLSMPYRSLTAGRNGQATKGSWVAATPWDADAPPPFPDEFWVQGILPVPQYGVWGARATGPGTWGFEVFPDVAVITRTYIKLLADWTTIGSPRQLLAYGLLANSNFDGAHPTLFTPSDNLVTLGSSVDVLASPSGDRCGLEIIGHDTSLFQHGSGPITVGEWHCLEVACRWGTSKSYFALRLDGAVISEASCMNAPLWSKFDLDVCTFGFGADEELAALYYLVDDIAINDETGSTDNTWPGPDTGVSLSDSGGCLADPAGSGYYDCGLSTQAGLPVTCPVSGGRVMCVL